MGINGVNHLKYGSASGVEQTQSPARQAKGNVSFGEMLQERAREKDSLNFSKHAAKRLDERGIQLDSSLLGNLEHAVEEARKKGAKDVAIIGSQGVFIVNVPNNIVVTTMSQDDTEKKIFTNTDSAVLI